MVNLFIIFIESWPKVYGVVMTAIIFLPEGFIFFKK